MAHAHDASPRECCGLLLGAGQAITEAAAARNLAEGVSRFLIDPADHIAQLRESRLRGLEVLGFYHSHPRSAAWPSEADVAEAAYPDAVHLIVSLVEDKADARLFYIQHGAIIEAPLTPVS